MTASQERVPEIAALTSLRGVAALWVVFFHMRYETRRLFPGLYELLEPWIKAGYLGVDLFFVLSGFVIALNYQSSLVRPSLAGYRRFVVKRLARIYPAYALALLLIVLAWQLVDAYGAPYPKSRERFAPSDLVDSVFMLQAWTYPVKTSWNIPDWSVSSEWMAYLLFPVYLMLFRPLRSRARLIAGWLGLVVAYWGAITWIGRERAVELAPLRVLACFGCGVLIYRLHQHAAGSGRLATAAAVVTMLASGPLYVVCVRYGIDTLCMGPLLFSLIVFCLARPSAQGGLAVSRFSRWLGAISYAVYLIHDIVLFLVRGFYSSKLVVHDPWATRAGYLVAELILIIALAHAIHRFVEEPARRAIVGRFASGGLRPRNAPRHAS